MMPTCALDATAAGTRDRSGSPERRTLVTTTRSARGGSGSPHGTRRACAYAVAVSLAALAQPACRHGAGTGTGTSTDADEVRLLDAFEDLAP